MPEKAVYKMMIKNLLEQSCLQWIQLLVVERVKYLPLLIMYPKALYIFLSSLDIFRIVFVLLSWHAIYQLYLQVLMFWSSCRSKKKYQNPEKNSNIKMWCITQNYVQNDWKQAPMFLTWRTSKIINGFWFPWAKRSVSLKMLFYISFCRIFNIDYFLRKTMVWKWTLNCWSQSVGR